MAWSIITEFVITATSHYQIYASDKGLPSIAQRCSSETEKFILENLFILVFLRLKKQKNIASLKTWILIILAFPKALNCVINGKDPIRISLALNFTPNTLGCYGLKYSQCENTLFVENCREGCLCFAASSRFGNMRPEVIATLLFQQLLSRVANNSHATRQRITIDEEDEQFPRVLVLIVDRNIGHLNGCMSY